MPIVFKGQAFPVGSEKQKCLSTNSMNSLFSISLSVLSLNLLRFLCPQCWPDGDELPRIDWWVLSHLRGPCKEPWTGRASGPERAPAATGWGRSVFISSQKRMWEWRRGLLWCCSTKQRKTQPQRKHSHKPYLAEPFQQQGVSRRAFCPPPPPLGIGPSSIRGKVSIQNSSVTHRKPGGSSQWLVIIDSQSDCCSRKELQRSASPTPHFTDTGTGSPERIRVLLPEPPPFMAFCMCTFNSLPTLWRALISSNPGLTANIYPLSTERPNEDCSVFSSGRIRVLS
jgi:hypothetical protein